MRFILSVFSVLTLISLALPDETLAQKREPIQATPTTQPRSQPAARTLKMEEAIELALRNSKALRIAEEGVYRARGRVQESRAAFLPTLNADVTFTRLDEGSEITFPGPNGTPVTIPIVKQDQKSVGVVAALPIDITGQIRAAVDLSQFQEIAARLDYNKTRNQVVLDVKNAFYDLLRAKAFVVVQEQALKNAQDRLSTAESYLRAGTGTRFDVLRAETEVANAQQNLIAARNRVSLATAALNNVLSLDQNTPLEVVETGDAAAPSTDFNEAIEEAYKTRPEVLQADANIRAAEKGLVLANRSTLPSLALTWNFSYTPDQGGFAPKETSWFAAARLSLPLFDQGIYRARRDQAKADINSAKLARQTILDGIALEVRQAYLALVEAQERLNVATAVLTQAQEQYRLAQVRFKAGVTQVPGGSPLLEVSDAQTALTQAQSNQINAQYDLQNARARLERAMGRYAFDGTTRVGLPGPNPGGKKQ